MSLVREVRQRLEKTRMSTVDLDEALLEAERLSDLFREVKPQPYVVPVERFAGLPVFRRDDGRSE